MGNQGSTDQISSSFVPGLAPMSVASHELKAPLALIRQLGLELADTSLSDAERRRIQDQIVHVSAKALRLTTDLTKAEATQTNMFPVKPTNPLDVARDVVYELGSMYELHGKRFGIKRLHKLPPVVANRDLLRRILLNFADNALHYSNVDGMVELQGQLLSGGNVVRLGIRDYGPALPSASWQKLIRSMESTKRVHARPGSSGLGIRIAHTFAESMNGRIGAIRHRDGASFYVELPVSRQLELL